MTNSELASKLRARGELNEDRVPGYMLKFAADRLESLAAENAGLRLEVAKLQAQMRLTRELAADLGKLIGVTS